MKRVYTVGYGGLKIDDFIKILQKNNVTHLIDLRELPVSRKPGFSKKALQSHLEKGGILYSHFRALGSPMALRHQVREDRDYRIFFKGVHAHLETPPALESLRAIEDLIGRSACCLMCFCQDWTQCHRRCIVENLECRQEIEFIHIGASDRPASPVLPFMRKAA
ncbi:DUF488 domain-containing protein [Planctomicrobium sp. SH527]|uniref:DUF488 domain-containing protein n=1 Tax=Planctomicrobium sp. SH527 TaxID=3448123 RepID=UPI003F5C3787